MAFPEEQPESQTPKFLIPTLGNREIDPSSKKTKWGRYLAFAGPGVLVSVGYMDPGNWGTDIAAGSSSHYTLLWAVLLSSLIAMFLQNLCARLGLAGDIDLAQACHLRYSKSGSVVLWVFAQVAIIACDLAEVIGSAVALQLLLGIPLIWGVVITAFDVLLLIGLMQFGFRKLEAVVTVLVLMVSGCFLLEIFKSQPDWGSVIPALFTPKISNLGEAALAVGILGATVMPHNLYLHSALVQTRKVDNLEEALKMNAWDTYLSLVIAFFVNAAILVVAAATFYAHGHRDVNDLGQAQDLLRPLLGGAAATIFAVGLLASGQSSTITGTLAGQVVMKGLLGLKWKPWVQRVVTRGCAIVPAAVAVIIYGGHNTIGLLVASQIVLSMQLPFAVFPLLKFTADPKIMGIHANGLVTRITGGIVGWLIVFLNAYLIWDSLGDFWLIVLGLVGVGFAVFLEKSAHIEKSVSLAA